MSRIEVLKTYKLYIGGKFPRTESGRYYKPEANGKVLGNICLSSRKDFRNAMLAARSGFGSWKKASAFNKSQILYRMAEMLEGRKAQFVDELMFQGSTQKQAISEVEEAIDRMIYFAGWCDKFQAVFSSVNPVSSSHFNFSMNEPMGVVVVMASQKTGLLDWVTGMLQVIAGGNSCIIIAPEDKPLCSISMAEVLNTSDLPAGVVNILTGKWEELLPHVSTHMDVNGIYYSDENEKTWKEIELSAHHNVKRVHRLDAKSDEMLSPYPIMNFQEVKTTWHPIEKISGAGSGY
jgi:acyl-CoA reductase-like NAD-dependent aldehyde dehydrogenase